ncbi:MAG: hypothetical protein M1839_009141 [Geoglossum umbratile]|nr:MAG: hypothetical protein M1839_009141 [Geoglossum umbratile]
MDSYYGKSSRSKPPYQDEDWDDPEQGELELAMRKSRISAGTSGGHRRGDRRSSSSQHVDPDLEMALRLSREDAGNAGSHKHRDRRSSSSQHEDPDLEMALRLSREDAGNAGGHKHRDHRSSSSRYVEPEKRSGAHSSREQQSLSKTKTVPSTTTASSLGKGGLPPDIESGISSLKKLYSNYKGTVCRSCRAPVGAKVSTEKHIRQWNFGISSSGGASSICSTTCSGCRALTCLGCGQKPRVGVNSEKTRHGVADWCCDGGRLVAIWIMMASYDDIHLDTEEVVRSRRSEGSSNSGGKGVGYAGEDERDFNPWVPIYDSFSGLSNSKAYTRPVKYKQADSMTDEVLEKIIFFICALLPTPSGSSEFDQSPPLTLHALFQLGFLLDKIAELLRNDSINDMCARATLYFGALKLVQKLAGHWKTSDIVTGERYSKSRSRGLKAIVKAEPTKDGPLRLSGTCSSLASLLQGLVKQSQIILQTPTEFGDRSGQATLELCSEVVTLGVTIESISSSSGKGKGKPASDLHRQKPEDRWAAFHKEHGLEQTESLPGRYFFYLAELVRLRHSLPGRIPRIIKEVAEMSTGLPPGILVRNSLERPDAMKALIIGPDDTPYAGGLFEFDIFPGDSYPREPPQVHFLTTGGGISAMNPNLYANGHVCLSLLGTWDGPPESKWQSNKSTILQVLLSIQSMILVADPWRNEPSNQDDHSPVAAASCRRYSLERQVHTILYAQLPWLSGNDSARLSYPGYSVWKDVVDVYFRIHGPKVLKQAKDWARKNEAVGRSGSLDKLQRALARRGYV